MKAPEHILGFNPNIFYLGIVSFLTDVSSELIFTLMPLFLSNVLGAATLVIGLIEGIAETSSSLLKIASGYLSDRYGNRKQLSFVGYAVSTLSKPFMLVAGSWGLVLGIRFADRFGKGVRTAPRDALVADSADSDQRGRAYGFHRAMDTSGAATGLMLAAVVIFLLQQNTVNLQTDTYRWLVMLSLVPAFAALFFFLGIKEPPRVAAEIACAVDPTIDNVEKKTFGHGFSLRYKLFLFVIFLFTLGNSSDAFIILRAQELGNSVLMITLMLLMFNIVYALFSVPSGIISDRLGRKRVIIVGWSVYAAVYLGLAITNQGWLIWLLFACYGLYYGLVEGVARAFVCDLVPENGRGAAFGMYHGIVGLTLLPASLIAGWLWQAVSPAAPFYFGALLAVLAALGLAILIEE